MGLRVRLDVDQPRSDHLLHFRPVQCRRRADEFGVHEDRRLVAELLEHRIGDLVDGFVAVIHRQDHRLAGYRRLAFDEVGEVGEADHRKAVIPQILQLAAEARGRHRQQVAFAVPRDEPVIGQDRDLLVAVAKNAGLVGPAQGNDHLLARQHAVDLVEIGNHPVLAGIAEIGRGETVEGLAPAGGHDDEIVAPRHHVGAATRKRRSRQHDQGGRSVMPQAPTRTAHHLPPTTPPCG